jgi:hypothetical protein
MQNGRLPPLSAALEEGFSMGLTAEEKASSSQLQLKNLERILADVTLAQPSLQLEVEPT